MSVIIYPGGKVEDFVTDLIMEKQPRGSREHGSPKRPDDGRVYFNDGRVDSPWKSNHDDKGGWWCCYGLPTELLDNTIRERYGCGALSCTLELIRWNPSPIFTEGARLLLAKMNDGIGVYWVCLEVPNYTGLRNGDRVKAKWWDNVYHDAVVCGLDPLGKQGIVYRMMFPHINQTEQTFGRYIDVRVEDIQVPQGG